MKGDPHTVEIMSKGMLAARSVVQKENHGVPSRCPPPHSSEVSEAGCREYP